ncbi:DNA polymerase beta domain-containing protein [Planococcus antarcticus DSM 14505]|uniref:DNA polymerase III subunit beta n=1 Tax=Planococcus antarcticus DSM 14505 TaxID=1185653 RepID=A0A1C7DE11_9BACL|nr:nucleotidyltransferase domain-containing protein [Planococcus antarcticus]ANU09483.1 DNA polymerase III subunit beta [Planococcus antarcticus DSM 14505]EIM06259.1 DNA polymerase beta domain-containing protein [Planococcus antarcticus DSM 14505]
MLLQEIAVEKITASLIQSPYVRAIFLKGSMGRDEHDEHSDIDLYCLVEKEQEEHFLKERLTHLQAYRPVLFQDDIFIIAPQLIAVFDDLLHIDLFTVTVESFIAKDFFKVVYDPENLLDQFAESQSLELSKEEYKDHVIDVAWFLFQYRKAGARGNGVWAVKMLSQVLEHLARVLLYRYAPERAQLGLKAISHSLPELVFSEIENISSLMTPENHAQAASQIRRLLAKEAGWIDERVSDRDQIMPLMKKMIEIQGN